MLRVGIIGLGNTGNQVASLGAERLKIPAIAINSSEKDLDSVPNTIVKKLIKNKTGDSTGAGKDRTLAKKYLKDSVNGLLMDTDIQEILSKLDVIFVVSSTGGGTGSGTAPIMAQLISSQYVDAKCILVGVLPVNSEALSAHVNTLQYLDELYRVLQNQTYMLYDNDKLSGLPSPQLLRKVNEEIISDIDVLRCTYNTKTQYDSIDDRDMTRLISFGGRIMVSRLEGFQEKDCDNQTIEDMIISNIKRNCHVESQRDHKVMATGIITNLSESLTSDFDNNIPSVREFVGVPVHSFSHITVNEDRKMPNNVFFIATGLTPINDRINKISDRVDEIEEKQKIMEEANALSDVDLKKLSESVEDEEKEVQTEDFNINDVFGRFGL